MKFLLYFIILSLAVLQNSCLFKPNNMEIENTFMKELKALSTLKVLIALPNGNVEYNPATLSSEQRQYFIDFAIEQLKNKPEIINKLKSDIELVKNHVYEIVITDKIFNINFDSHSLLKDEFIKPGYAQVVGIWIDRKTGKITIYHNL